ncbi:conserved exported protein of unknown function [Nitrospira japonica]|uniref:Lipoprotein n=1 Tax=Nitrospira japonica TaxID=1325564 RepID=A0A1W1IA97_9BACT|nr:integrase [Nitrospira japonica]SLM49944.1 conserved exported protein of unknown function [Nitrospira japonica]
MRCPIVTTLVFGMMSLAGCAATIPVNYTAQNFARYEGRANVGSFQYVPANTGKVAPNQIQSTAIGSIYVAANVADLVQRATALELEKTGFRLGDNNPLVLSGDILEFQADDLGYSVDWSYSIRYKISRKADGSELLNKIYLADRKTTGKFGEASDYAPSINEMILSGYDKFIRDDQVRKIFSQ